MQATVPTPPSPDNPTQFRLWAFLSLMLQAISAQAWQVDHRLEISHGTLVIDHGKTAAEITRAQAKGGFPAGIGLGLFQNRMRSETSVSPVDVARQGKRLSLVTRISTTPVIYLAKELPAGSCSYQVVLEHELTHQQYDLEVLRSLSDELRRASQEIFSPEELDRLTQASLGRGRDQLLQRLKFAYDAQSFIRHPAIDNLLSYAELSGRCNGEIGRMVAKSNP